MWGPASIAIARERRARRHDDGPKQDIYTLLPDGTGLHRVTRTNVPFLLNGLQPTDWSADGKRLLAEFGGQDTSYAETVNPANGRVRKVGRLRDGVIGYRLSKDGRTILAATGGFEGTNHNVVTYPYHGGAATVLVHHATDPDWTR